MLTKFLTAAFLVLALSSAAVTQEPDTRMGPRRKAPASPGQPGQNAVLQLEHDWVEAYLKHDIAALEDILADDWTYSPSDGTFNTRSQVIEDFRVATMKYESIAQQNVKVRIYGNTAVVTGDEIIKGSDGGKPVNQHIRFTDVLVNRNGHWHAVASHETAIPEAA